MKIVILDSKTLGDDIDFSLYDKFGEVTVYDTTMPQEVQNRICGADIIIVNKVKLNSENLSCAKNLKLICVTATGFDNIDLKYCRESGIGVANVRGYSTNSVAQVTVSMALSLVNHIPIYDSYVKDKSYTASGVQNCLVPVYHEIAGMTWGIVGLGAIGRKTAQIAKALGAEVIAYNRSQKEDYTYVGIDELCRKSDIISIHLPLNNGTKGLISAEKIAMMKNTAIVINVARGAVVDERALCSALLGGKIGGLGIDVYSVEPMQPDSPYNSILTCKNALLTPHMAWGAYESRVRCMQEIEKNITAFLNGETRNRVEI